jgi:HAD superfamily hydrolase (TIGR01509 family)
MAAIKNIIFDLGGVLLNIGYNNTSIAFKNLGIENFDEMFSQFKSNDLFEKLETGNISEDDFYKEIKKASPVPLTDKEINVAWDAMLLDFRIDSLNFLETLKDKYNIYLLSNTNAIHHRAFAITYQLETGKVSLDDYFIKAYYSHIVGLRKPNADIYEFVLADGNMKREETLFIDDSINNIETAIKLGLKTHHLLAEERIENLGL